MSKLRIDKNHYDEIPFFRHCSTYPVLGFDCEWVTVKGSRRPVALLQLSSYEGQCVLFRLCRLQTLGPELTKLLENDNVLKVGVAPRDDASKLWADYGVNVGSTFDLRYMAFEANLKAEGLARMSKTILNVELDKDWRTRCSDWEAESLTPKQIDYAAKDAIVGVELFKKMSDQLVAKTLWTNGAARVKEVLSICSKYADVGYKELTIGKTVVPLAGCPGGPKNQSK